MAWPHTLCAAATCGGGCWAINSGKIIQKHSLQRLLLGESQYIVKKAWGSSDNMFLLLLTPIHCVKCTLVQALRLCTGRTAHRGSRGIALLNNDHSTRKGWEVSVTHRLLFTSGKDTVPIVQGAGWAPEPVWAGAENLATTGIRSPDRPAHSQSLYRLRYPAHTHCIAMTLQVKWDQWVGRVARMWDGLLRIRSSITGIG